MIQAGGIFMASKVKKKQNLQGLTEQQKHIIKLRNELNKPDPHQVKAFTLYKIITYVFNVLFPPYALYRIWCKKPEFTKIERYAQSVVAVTILCMFVLLQLERYKII